MSRLARARATAQLLHRPPTPGGAAGVVRHLLAVQAQDLRAARLALRARAEGIQAADVHVALTEERSLVVAWLNRGTLHLVARDDYAWLLALTAPTRLTANRRRLGQEGVTADDAERAVVVVERALADEGPLTRPQLAERIAAHGIRTEGQATPHLLMLAALRGVAVLGPVRDEVQAYALTRDWLGAPPAPADRDTALGELARRYLAGHAPAAPEDLAAWSGLPLRDARAGLERAGAPAQAPDAPVPPRLLGAFDPYLLGWKDRAFAVPAEQARQVHPGGGILRPVATRDGRVVGTWSPARRQAPPGFEDELADVARFESL